MPRRKRKSVAILIDSTISISYISILSQLRSLIEKEIGRIKVAKIVLFQKQALETAKEISLEGFLPVIVHDDLDIHFALEAMELIYNEKIHTIVIASENEDFLPLFIRAQEIGKEIVLIQVSDELNRGLQNAADIVFPIIQ